MTKTDMIDDEKEMQTRKWKSDVHRKRALVIAFNDAAMSDQDFLQYCSDNEIKPEDFAQHQNGFVRGHNGYQYDETNALDVQKMHEDGADPWVDGGYYAQTYVLRDAAGKGVNGLKRIPEVLLNTISTDAWFNLDYDEVSGPIRGTSAFAYAFHANALDAVPQTVIDEMNVNGWIGMTHGYAGPQTVEKFLKDRIWAHKTDQFRAFTKRILAQFDEKYIEYLKAAVVSVLNQQKDDINIDPLDQCHEYIPIHNRMYKKEEDREFKTGPSVVAYFHQAEAVKCDKRETKVLLEDYQRHLDDMKKYGSTPTQPSATCE